MSTTERREFGNGHYVEVKTQPCGLRAYAAMNMPHNWSEVPLNRCGNCGREITRWNAAQGHHCTCRWTCNGRCRAPEAHG